jgi:hypothetical protein
MIRKRLVTLLIAIAFSLSSQAEVWVSTSELQLRSDIETLADIGAIRTPVTSYPLMWAGIIKDLDNTDIESVPFEYKALFWRVKKAGKAAFSGREKRLLKMSVASNEQVFRSFGDTTRSRAELSANYTNTNKYFAWNVQVNRLLEPFDQDKLHYDNSYLAGVLGNWVFSVGKVEKWWGASWDSATLLSNNARAPLAISVDRNYSDAIDSPWLSWIGPFSLSSFVGQLDDERFIANPNLAGLSFTAKPLDWLELGLRTTSISSGSYTGVDSIVEQTSKQINGLDLRWNIASSIPTSVYVAVTDEQQEANLATQQFGLTSSFKLFRQDWRVVLESTKTFTSEQDYDLSYEDEYYQSGYRYHQRAIGSTYDNDSSALTLSLFGNLTRHQFLQIKIQDLMINQQDATTEVDSSHTITTEQLDVKRLAVSWDYQATKKHRFKLGVEVTDKTIQARGRQSERVRASASWSYYL